MDVGASFNRALERFKPHAVPLVLGALVVVVTSWIIGAISGAITFAVGGIIGGLVGGLISAVLTMGVSGILWGGLWTMVGKAYMGAAPVLGDMATATKSGRLNEFLVVGAVISAGSLVAAIPFVGLLSVFVMPVLYFLFVPAMIMVAEGSDAKTALSASKALTTANAKTFFLAYLVGGLVSIFVITLPLGLLIIIDTYFSVKNAQPGVAMQQVAPQGYDPNQQYQQQYQQPPQGGGYPPQGGGYPPG